MGFYKYQRRPKYWLIYENHGAWTMIRNFNESLPEFENILAILIFSGDFGLVLVGQWRMKIFGVKLRLGWGEVR